MADLKRSFEVAFRASDHPHERQRIFSAHGIATATSFRRETPMLRRAPSCHEGETADRAAAVMRQLDVEVVPVLNDNDSATGLALGEELDRALRRPGGHRLRLREVMRRLGFVVCRWSEGRSVAENLAGKAQKKLDDVKRVLGS